VATPLTAGTARSSVQFAITGASIAPQGASSSTIVVPTADAVGAGQVNFEYGTASGQCDIYCAAEYVLTTAGATQTIDIYANGLPNLFGGTADFRKLKGVYFGIVSGGDTGGVAVGGAASNANKMFFSDQTDKWTIRPGQVPLVGSAADGITVDATNRNIKIENTGAVTVRVIIMLCGTSV
jgi:hypothetical protein